MGGENYGSLGTVAVDELGWSVDVDDAAVLDDGYAIAQALGLLHQMSGKKNGLAVLADISDEIPNGAARLGIETGGQLVEENNFGIVDQRESNEEPLLLTAGKIHKPSVALVGESETFEEAFGIDGFLVVKRGPEVHGLPHLDTFLQLGLLELNSDASLQLVDLTKRIKAEN